MTARPGAMRLALAAAVVVVAGLLGIAGLLLWRQHRATLTSGAQLVGRAAPDFRLKRLDGEPGDLALSDLQGRPVLLEFFATWCPPCQRIGSAVAEFAANYSDRGLVTLGVSFDDAESVAKLPEYLASHHVGFPVVGEGRGHAGAVKDAYGVLSIPHLILISPDGRIASADLSAATPEETLRNLQLAVLPRLAKAVTR